MPNRHFQVLMAGIILFLNCFLISGCGTWGLRWNTTIFGESVDRFPAIVLSTQNPQDHNYTFNWDTHTVGGMPLSKHMPDAKYWRLNVFSFKNGTLL